MNADTPQGRSYRWAGTCHGCQRTAELESRYDLGARALCDDCAAAKASPAETASSESENPESRSSVSKGRNVSHSLREGVNPGPGPGPGPGTDGAKTLAEEPAEEPSMRELLRLHAEGRVVPEPFAGLGDLPANASRAMRALHDLLNLRFGLRLADGTSKPMMLATSELVAKGIVVTKGGASHLLHQFEDLGIIWSPGSMPPLGKGDGTRLSCRGRSPKGRNRKTAGGCAR